MPDPSTSVLIRALVRWRWHWSAVVALIFAVSSHPYPLDLRLFATGGRQLLGGRLDNVYANAEVQAGPFQLVLSQVLSVGSDGDTPALALRIAVDLALVLIVRAVARRVDATPLVATAAAAMTALWLGPWGFWSGHPSEVLIVAAWLCAGGMCLRGRPGLAGLALAAGVAVAPWAVLGFPVALAGRIGVAVRAGVVATIGVVVTYLPFVLTGHFHLFAHRWPVAPTTLVHLLDPAAVFLGWWARLVQAAVTAGACGATVLALRARREAVFAAVLVAALMRVISDPLRFDYYWIPVAAAAVVAALALSRGHRPLFLIALAYVPWLATTVSQAAPWLTTAIGVGYLLAVATWIALAARSGRSSATCSPGARVRTGFA